MRVLHVLDHSLPLHSGYVFRSLGLIGAQKQFGWETTLLTGPRFNNGRDPELIDGWCFRRTPKPATPLLTIPLVREIAEMRGLRVTASKAILETCPDIVHAHSPVLTGIPAFLAARSARIPFVYEVRAFWEDAAVDLGHSKEGDLRYRTTRMLETALLRRADAVVTICEGLRGEMIGRGIAASKITVVPNAVDEKLVAASAPYDLTLARTLDLENKVVLGFIGSFYHYEGLDILVRALPEIRRRIPNAVILLVGGGPEEVRLKDLVAELSLADHVRFVGRVPHEEIQKYYRLVQFFVYPRRSIRLTELVTPLKPLEAMAQGGIVLASDIGGHRELISDGATGYLFPPDDAEGAAAAIAKHVSSIESHEQVRQAARDFVERERNWTTSASRYKIVYDSLKAHGLSSQSKAS